MVLDDGMSIVGSTWVVGYKPTGRNSVQNKGGLWLNEVGMEYTKKEMMMIDLNNAVVGDEFETKDNQPCVVVARTDYNVCFELLDGADLLFTTGEDGVPELARYKNLAIKSKHEPVILEHGQNYEFTIGKMVNCLGWYDSNRKSFMNCDNKVCGACEATHIVRLDKASG